MRKNVHLNEERERVLARTLAEDLRRVAAGVGLTPTVTDPPPRADITNGAGDNDGPD